ncbi:hypothetical protein [Streptomyces achmelvichensis]|uniref:hypothetical protein n=1 Tax=Streptomyces achmelvichensis TaxID=3134111 RepID=UPI003C12C7EF
MRDVGLGRVGVQGPGRSWQLTIRPDVAMWPNSPFIGRTRGMITSPPCQAWSMAGKRLGLLDQPLVHAAVEDLAAGRDTRERLLAACRVPRRALPALPSRCAFCTL